MIHSIVQLFVFFYFLFSCQIVNVHAVLPDAPTGEPTSAPSSIPGSWTNEGSLVLDSDLSGFVVASLATFLNSRGTATFAVTAPAAGTVSFLLSTVGGQDKFYQVSSVLASTTAMYGAGGADIRVIGDKVTGPLAFFPSTLNSDSSTFLTYARGSHSQWSVQQWISIDSSLTDKGGDTTGFASVLGADRHDFRTLAVGAYDAEITAENKGAVFVYQATNPAVKAFSLQQILYSDTLNNALGYSFVDVYGKTLIASGTRTTTSAIGAAIFTQAPNGIWSQQQQLAFNGANNDALRGTVYEDSIIVGYPAVDAGTPVRSDSGAVEVYEPSKPAPKRPVQWSLAQRILSNHPAASEGFGIGVATDGTTLAVGSAGTEYNLYIFKKVNNRWTANAQMFSGASTGISSLWVHGNLAVAKTTADIAVWNDNTAWDCLYVSLGDHFGDGWDGASLRVETPFGEVDNFDNHCAVSNPFVFRYCPSYASQGGVYKFSIADAPAAAFDWEIFWKVYVESEGRWISGDAATQLDFIFDSEKLAFKAGALRRDVGNATCTECAQKPQPKVKSHPHRKLATSGPTFLQTDYGDWQLFTSTGAGVDDWFSADSQGVFYSIADLKGQRLFHKNTFCPASEDKPLPVRSCWNHLPDGEYVLRVSSGLARNTDSLDRTWTFCNTQGIDSTQLVFRVGNHSTTCSPLYKMNIENYCEEGIIILGIIDIQLFISGVSISSVSALSSSDLTVLTQAVSSVQAGISDVSVLGIENTETGTLFSLELTVSLTDANVNARDREAMSSFETTVNTKFASNEDQVWSVLASNKLSDSVAFRAATSVSLFSFKFAGIEFSNPNAVNEATFTYQNAVSASNNNALPASESVSVTQSSSESVNVALLVSSYGGYALAVAVAAIALVVVLRKAASSIQSANVEVKQTAPVVPASVVSQVEMGMSPAKKTSDFSGVALEDMLKMVRDEDEMLAKAREVGTF